jgi:hypothetical protein
VPYGQYNKRPAGAFVLGWPIFQFSDATVQANKSSVVVIKRVVMAVNYFDDAGKACVHFLPQLVDFLI